MRKSEGFTFSGMHGTSGLCAGFRVSCFHPIDVSMNAEILFVVCLSFPVPIAEPFLFLIFCSFTLEAIPTLGCVDSRWWKNVNSCILNCSPGAFSGQLSYSSPASVFSMLNPLTGLHPRTRSHNILPSVFYRPFFLFYCLPTLELYFIITPHFHLLEFFDPAPD